MSLNFVNFIKHESINSELELLEIDFKDYGKKLLVLTDRAKNEEEAEKQSLLIKKISAINFAQFKSQNTANNIIRKVSCFSPVNFVSGLVPKESAEKSKREFVLLISNRINSSKELAKTYQKNNEAHLSKCCQTCQEELLKVKEIGDSQVLYKFVFCANPNCQNFGLVNKSNEQI